MFFKQFKTYSVKRLINLFVTAKLFLPIINLFYIKKYFSVLLQLYVICLLFYERIVNKRDYDCVIDSARDSLKNWFLV